MNDINKNIILTYVNKINSVRKTTNQILIEYEDLIRNKLKEHYPNINDENVFKYLNELLECKNAGDFEIIFNELDKSNIKSLTDEEIIQLKLQFDNIVTSLMSLEQNILSLENKLNQDK